MYRIILKEDITIPQGTELELVDGFYVANLQTSERTSLVLSQSIDEELMGDLYEYATPEGVIKA